MDAILQPGITVADRYVIERELGRGGMATVFLAHDRKHDARIALKVLHPDVAPLVGGERFAREIHITAALQHPNILPVLDSGEVGGLPFYTMPFVEGETLAARLARDGQLAVDDAVQIACEVAEALAYAHERGFVHRDIKPANILLSHGHAMLADFGIARTVDVSSTSDRITDSGVSLGTVLYISPEQGTGGEVDARSDVYSLGCVIYETLAGQPPFTGRTFPAVLARHVMDPVPSLRTVRSAVSPALEQVVTRALAKVPADRFASATELRHALTRATTSEATTASIPLPPRRARRRWLAGGALAVLAAIGAGVVWRVRGSSAMSSLDPHRVTVYPLAVPASFGGARSAGEDVATMIGTAVDHAGPLRWVDGWRAMRQARHENLDALTDDDMRAIARAQRSRFYVTGRLVPRPGTDSVDVVVELNDAASDTAAVVDRASARAVAADSWRAGLRAFNRLLPRLIPGSAADLSAEWATREPAAVARFLLGEAAFRRVHVGEALAHYEAAVATDSTFALAAVRGAQAATWNHRPREAASLIRLALAHPITPRYRHFAQGYRAYLEGRPDSASAELRRALRIDPEMAAAWMQLGETYTHLLPVAGRPDSLADDAFARARELDPSATHLLLHPIEARLRRGALVDAAPMLQRFLAADPDTTLAEQVRLMDACVRRGPAEVDWKRAVAGRPFAVLAAAHSLSVRGAQLPCAAAAYAAVRTFETREMAANSPDVDGRRWAALVGLQAVLLAQGDDAAAAALVDSAVALGEGGRSLFLVQAPLSSTFRARAVDAARHYDARWGRACAQCVSTESLWQLAAWSAHTGDAATAATVAARAAERARTGTLADTVMARAAWAWAALARHDSAAARAAFASLLAEPVPSGSEMTWTPWAPRVAERLAYAQLLMARGDHRAALAVADVFDSPAPQIAVAYMRASLALRAAAADSLRDQGAARYRARLDSLGPMPTVARRE